MRKILVIPSLAAALLMSAQPLVLSQEKSVPDDSVKPGTATPKPPKAPRKTGVATIDDADFITTTPEVGVAPPTVKRSSNARFTFTREREDIAPLVVQFSGKNDGLDPLQEDLTILTVRIRKAIEGGGDEEASGRSVRGTSGSSVRSMYLEGFGTLVF